LQTQRFYFEAQIAIAIEHQLPLIIHAHRAVEAVYDCLKLHNAHAGVIHSFNGSLVQAQRLIDQGFMLGFGGAATYPRARKLRELIVKLPLDALLLETDAPFQPSCNAPPHRNEPCYLKDVFDLFCALRQESPQSIAEITTHNASRLFSPGSSLHR
jgi:TatD DNase family protein